MATTIDTATAANIDFAINLFNFAMDFGKIDDAADALEAFARFNGHTFDALTDDQLHGLAVVAIAEAVNPKAATDINAALAAMLAR